MNGNSGHLNGNNALKNGSGGGGEVEKDPQRRNIKRTFSSEDADDFDIGVQRSRSKLGLKMRHRHPQQRAYSNESLDGMQQNGGRGQRRSGNTRTASGKRHPGHGSSKPFYQNSTFRWLVAVLCIAYLVVMTRILSQATSDLKTDEQTGNADTPLLLGPTSVERHVQDSQTAEQATEARLQMMDRNSGRKYRTTPDANGIHAHHIPAYTFQTVDRELRDDHPKAIKGTNPQDVMRPAQPDELCGILAKTKALEHPNSYIHKDSLNEHARVIINGILNPVGFHLALALEEKCGAQVISGFDQAFPNSVPHRMGIQEEAGILTSRVTTLERPIFNSFLGLDPKVKNPAWPMITVTGELDISKWQPTHIVHLSSFAPELFRNNYDDTEKKDIRNDQSPYVKPDYDPKLYSLRSSVVPMEQIMASISLVGNKPRLPHFTYASSNQVHTVASNNNAGKKKRNANDEWQSRASLMTEVLADTYYQTHGTYSVGVRLPNAIYGPRGHSESDIRRLVQGHYIEQSDIATNPNTTWTSDEYDMVHMDDIVDGIIAAMQFRNAESKPVTMDFSSDATVTRPALVQALSGLRTRGNKPSPKVTPLPDEDRDLSARNLTSTFIGWKPKISLTDGLLRTVAWHTDHKQPWGPPTPKTRASHHVNSTILPKTGDEILQAHGLDTCPAEKATWCYSSRKTLPCASECNSRKQCTKSLLDPVMELAKEVSQDCDIVLYTQVLGDDVEDIALQAEFSEQENPSICNFAFVSGKSKVVDSVIKKVPAEEMKRLGVVPAEGEDPQVTKDKQRHKLNGRLLYRGWILVWVEEATPNPVPSADQFLLKLSPGKFFADSVQYAMYVDQSFPAMPTVEDVKFLAHQMHRPSWDQRTVKRKTRPKAKFRLPPEPERKAGLLLAQLKYQETGEVFPQDQRPTLNDAVKFMRFEKGMDTTETEPEDIRIYREFLERIPTYVNRGDYMKSSSEPVFFYELHHWVRTQWVMHDLTLEAARDLRCDWYQETVQWETPLDQLSMAHVMERREMMRRMANQELDDIQMRYYDEKRDMLGLLSDAEEWMPLDTPQNKLCPTNYELEVMPYDKADTGAEESTQTLSPQLENEPIPLYARFISDRIMSLSRKAWNKQKKAEAEAAAAEHKKEHHHK